MNKPTAIFPQSIRDEMPCSASAWLEAIMTSSRLALLMRGSGANCL